MANIVAECVVAYLGKGAHDGVADCIAENMVDGEGLTSIFMAFVEHDVLYHVALRAHRITYCVAECVAD